MTARVALRAAEAKADLGLNLSQVFTTNILSVAGTVFCRFAIGPLCDKIGPKICQFSLYISSSPIMMRLVHISRIRTLAAASTPRYRIMKTHM